MMDDQAYSMMRWKMKATIVAHVHDAKNEGSGVPKGKRADMIGWICGRKDVPVHVRSCKKSGEIQ